MRPRQTVFCVVAMAAGIGCSGADEHPLGGPYGGTGSATPPTSGEVAPASGGNDGGTTGTIGGGTGTGGTGGTGTGGTGTGGTGTGATPDAGSGGTGGGGTTDAGGGTGTGGAVDAGPVTPPPPVAPTWAQIYASYLSASSNGQCGLSGCHSQMATAAGAYSWLRGKGHINGAASKLVNPNTSRLTWYGGDMPPRGPSTWAQAVTDMDAWAKAGALQN
jgi:hypothetical protein